MRILHLLIIVYLFIPSVAQSTELLLAPVFKVQSEGKASWYSKDSPGIKIKTSNGEHFDDSAHTCAAWGIKFNKKVKVTNIENGKEVVCRVNDRGPHYRYRKEGRIIDLTKAAFSQIADPKKGLIPVKIEIL